MPRFSVIIPTKNRDDFLREAVASVLAQTETDLELLLVNDGASVTAFADSRVRVLENQQRGAVAARMLGVHSALGEVIAFLDDDDRWSSMRHLELAWRAIADGADFTFGDGILEFPDSDVRPFEFDATAQSLEHDNTILISAVCYRRALHEALGSFDETLPYYWDWDWYLRVARGGFRLQRVAEKTVSIRIHAQNMSGDANRQARLDNLSRFAAKHAIGPLTLKNFTDF
jgi:glycosyltransferase involved in cell wall biosynthesis